MTLSSRLAVSGQISGIIGRISGIIGRISGIIQPDIRYYMAGYPVRQLAGYPNPALKNCRISGYPVLVQSAGYPVIRQNHYPVHP